MAYPYDDSDPFAQPDAHFPPPPYGQIQGEPLPLFPYGYPPMVGGLSTNPAGAGTTEDAGSTGSGEAPPAPQPQPMHHLQEMFGMPPEESAEGPLAEVASVIQSWYGVNVHNFDPQSQHQDQSGGGFGGWVPSNTGDQSQARAPAPPPLQQPHANPTERKDEAERDSDPLPYLNGLAKSDYAPFAHVPSEDTLSGVAAWRLTVDPFPFSNGLEGAAGLQLQPMQTSMTGMRPDVLAKHAKDVEELQSYLEELISLMTPFAFTPTNPAPPPPPPYLHTRIARFAALIRDKLEQLEASSQTSLDPGFLDLPPHKDGGMSQAEKDMEFIRRRRDVLNAKARRDAQVAYVRPAFFPQAQRILPLPRCRACGGNMRGEVCENCYRRRPY